MNQEIKQLIDSYIKHNDNKLYAPIPHSYLKNMDILHNDRADVILRYIKMRNDLKTGIDIGSHWGEMCYVLEDIGIEMTAVESYTGAYKVLTALRDDCGRKFKTINDNIFNLVDLKYDIVLALNIFHHFIKTEEKYNNWKKLLKKLDCKVMFFQAHNVSEGQMIGAFKNFTPDEFIAEITKYSCFTNSRLLQDGKRPIYVLSV